MNARPIILVTGGTGVLGRAIVASLCATNRTVVANYYRDETRAREVEKQTGCGLWRADISDEGAVQTLFRIA